MTALDNDDDSYVVPKIPSGDDGKDSENEIFESITSHVDDTDHKVARNPACKPEAKDTVLLVAGAAIAANLLPAAEPHSAC